MKAPKPSKNIPKSKKKRPLIIGRQEIIDLPKMELFGIRAKVDTGAWTSSLHVEGIKKIRKGGVKFVKFYVPEGASPKSNEDDSTQNRMLFKLPIHKRKKVRSSNGSMENRYCIRTEVSLMGKTFVTDFSLTDRSKMEFPVLLGRKLLRKRFLVDVTKKNLSIKPPQEGSSL